MQIQTVTLPFVRGGDIFSDPQHLDVAGGLPLPDTRNAPPALAPLDPDSARELARRMNAALRAIDTRLEFAVHESGHQVVVRVVDVANGDVIRQFPAEEMLAVAEALGRLQGVLIRDKA